MWTVRVGRLARWLFLLCFFGLLLCSPNLFTQILLLQCGRRWSMGGQKLPLTQLRGHPSQRADFLLDPERQRGVLLPEAALFQGTLDILVKNDVLACQKLFPKHLQSFLPPAWPRGSWQLSLPVTLLCSLQSTESVHGAVGPAGSWCGRGGWAMVVAFELKPKLI